MNPDEHTIQETFLEVGFGHNLYMQDWGNKKAKNPIVFLHGGPGSGCHDGHKQLFDPSVQRVIFFDQRGAGKSVPHGSLTHNTMQDLVEDIEKIAKYLQLKTFTLTGGSWGSCLALAYALEYPKRVQAMVLRGIFTGSQKELDWINNGEWCMFFPELWDRYLSLTPKSHHGNPTTYHAERILGDNPEAVKLSAYTYDSVESGLLRLDDRFTPPPFEEFDPTEVRIEMHYFTETCFMPDQHIMNNAHKLKMPIWIVQGRYDFACPPVAAYELHQKLPNSNLAWTIAGHMGSDRSTYDVTRAILLQLAGET